MTEAIYKVGDILEFSAVIPRQFGLRTGPVRGLVIKISNPGYEYLSYRLLVSGPMDDTKDMMIYWVLEKDMLSAAKRVGHIDISALMFMENDEPDYEKMIAAFACMESADLRKLLDEEALKRKQAEAECKEKAKENVRLSYENSDLKAMNDELRSSWIERCTSCKQTEENKKLMDENAKLSLKLYDADEKIRKLEEENGKLAQKISCADKLLAEAAKRIYEAREYMNVALCDNE